MIVEQWKPTPTFPGYEASSLGRVRVSNPGKNRPRLAVDGVLTNRVSERGYYLVHLLLGGKRYGRATHRLVADAWLGPVPAGFEVNHIDGDKLNNTPENLEYTTRGENIRHAYAMGLRERKRGERGPASKLTSEQVREIRSMKGTMYYADIGRRFGVGQSTISSIMNRQSWTEV